MATSTSATKIVIILLLIACCGIIFYMNNKWIVVTINNYDERNYKKSALAERTNQRQNNLALSSTAITTRPISRKTNESAVVHSDKIVKEPPALIANEVQEAKTIGDADNDLAEKFMAIIAKERLAGLQRGCHVNKKKFGLDMDAIFRIHPNKRPRFYFSDKYRLLLCEVPKCGSTSWKKALITMEGVVSDKNPGDIRGDEAHVFGSYLNVWKQFNESDRNSVAQTMERISNYTRIMTVREPLERLVSAYKDKMLPTGTGGTSFGTMSQRIHKSYADVTNATRDEDRSGKPVHASWKEFVRYLLDDKRRIYIDAHWQLFSKMCYPCDVAYHYIAKLETIYHDAQYISTLLKYDMTPFFPVAKEKGRHDKWSTEYQNYFKELSQDERERLYGMYMEQYDLFGYSKPNFL